MVAGGKLGRPLSWMALRERGGASRAAETRHGVTMNCASSQKALEVDLKEPMLLNIEVSGRRRWEGM